MASILEFFPDLDPRNITACIVSLRRVIVSTLEISMKFPYRHGSIESSNEYRILTDVINNYSQRKKTCSIVTFNYDIGCDFALSKSGLGINYALERNKQKNEIKLLKLHGSINWLHHVDQNRSAIIPLYLDDYFKHFSLRISSSELKTIRIPIGTQLCEGLGKLGSVNDGEPFIVPPSWNKMEHHRAIRNVWSRAADELSEAEIIHVVGYSLPETDGFFRLLYALGVTSNKLIREISVFDPNSLVQKKFGSLLGPGVRKRFEYHQVDMGGAMNLLLNKTKLS